MTPLMRMLLLSGLLVAACDKPKPAPTPPALQCDVEITDGSARFSATRRAQAGQSKKALRKQTLEHACRAFCDGKAKAATTRGDGGGDAAAKACAARCLVDIDAAKIGARIHCGTAPAASAAPAPK